MKTTAHIIRQESIKYAIIGLLVAFAIISLSSGGVWDTIEFIGEFAPNCFLGVSGLYGAIWFLSRVGGKLIQQGKIGPYMVALSVTFLSLLIGMFSASLVGYFMEGLSDTNGIEDYIFKPIVTVFVFGGLPALLIGIGLGARLRKKISTTLH